METESLIGRTLNSVLVYPSEPTDPAWVNELTLPVTAWMVLLQFSDNTAFSIEPCEVSLSKDQYPSLGLRLAEHAELSTDCVLSNGTTIKAVSMEEANTLLPKMVTSVQESDPLGEGTTTQYEITVGSSGSLIVRHCMPPMILGLLVSGGAKT